MERKRSGIGIAAAIIFVFLLLNDLAYYITIVKDFSSIYLDMHMMFWWINRLAGVCASVFMIISLFGERRSRLLLVSCIINAVMYSLNIVDLLKDGRYKFLYSATFLMMFGSYILRTVIAIYLCIPSLQEKASWTGRIWFVPPVLSGIVSIVSIVNYLKEYWEKFAYHPLWYTFSLLPNVISIVSVFLFCLWLTEPVRIKKDKLQITES